MIIMHALPYVIHTKSTHMQEFQKFFDWCYKQFGAPGESWSYGILPGVYSPKIYDYSWKFLHEAQALQFALAWC